MTRMSYWSTLTVSAVLHIELSTLRRVEQRRTVVVPETSRGVLDRQDGRWYVLDCPLAV